MSTSYKDLGLVNTKEMFAKAVEGGYAVPAYNFNNLEQLQAIVQACVETKSPVILQVSSGARKYANANCFATWLKALLNLLKNWDAKFQSHCTLITATLSSFAKTVLTADSLR